MHVSPKFKRYKDTISGPYWVLERSVRAGGKVRKEIVGYVGKAESRAEAYKLAREKGLLT